MASRRVSVLVIDDEPEMVEMIEFCLSRRGYDVSTSPDGPTAVSLARCHHFELAICDLKMPGWDGIRTTRALKAVRPGLQVVIATGYATEQTMAGWAEDGVSASIRKPFTVRELEQVLAQVLAHQPSPPDSPS